MIDSKELRIGNYVFNPYDEYTNVDVTILDYIVKCNYTQQKVTRYKPIPLTEQWLIDLPEEIVIPEYIKNVHEFQNWYYWNNNKKDFDFKL